MNTATGSQGIVDHDIHQNPTRKKKSDELKNSQSKTLEAVPYHIPARPTKPWSQATSSRGSLRTESADSTDYSRFSSRPSTPLSLYGAESKNAVDSKILIPHPESPCKIYTLPRNQHAHVSETEKLYINRELPDPEGHIPSFLEPPGQAHLRFKVKKKPTRDLTLVARKSSTEDLSDQSDDYHLHESTSPAVAKVRSPQRVRIDEKGDQHYEDPKAYILPELTFSEPTRAAPRAPITFASTQFPLKERQVDTDGTLRGRARRKILFHKHSMQMFQVTFNGLAIFATWWWPRYYYILLPLITATVAINVVMIASLVFRACWNRFRPEEIIMPPTPETMVMLIPCYNETKEELLKSLDSLVAQQHLEAHKKAIMIVCDGKARGPGMQKSTGDYLLQDILRHRVERKYMTGAYTAWDQQPMDIVVQRGTYGGVPYYCMVKQSNLGKRDGLIVVRSFLYNFNRRHSQPSTVFSPAFFDDMCSYLIADAGIDNCDHVVGMDADTVFADDCIHHLLSESRYAHTVGVCGYVAVDWKGSRFNAWRLYQSAEYTIAQCLRRLHQSMVTHKVSCLPGCCQLLRVCEETCGDEVLIEKFGYCPQQTDGLLKQIRATASEDRNHVCHMLSARPKAQTRQAIKAKAYTDVPHSWSVFLSQRRRWTLGATSNDLLLAFARGVQWFERILALVNVVTWILNPFIIASLASFIFAIITVPAWIIMCFVGVMLVPIVYYVFIPFWLHKSFLPRLQFWLGLLMYIFCGPFLNIAVLLYASFYMDSFGWGKTRKVISEDSDGETGEGELLRLDLGDAKEKTKSNTQGTGVSTERNEGMPPTRDCADEEKRIGVQG